MGFVQINNLEKIPLIHHFIKKWKRLFYNTLLSCTISCKTFDKMAKKGLSDFFYPVIEYLMRAYVLLFELCVKLCFARIFTLKNVSMI